MPSYTPAPVGSTLALLHGHRALLVEAPDDAARIEALWTTVSSAASLHAVLEVLAADGIAKTPGFALVELDEDGSANSIVRGDVVVHLHSAAGERVVDATQATTWVEAAAEAVTHVAIGDAGPAIALPLADGAAWASSLTLIQGSASDPAVVEVPDQLVAAAPVSAPDHIAVSDEPLPVEIVEAAAERRVAEATLATALPEQTINPGSDEATDEATVVVERPVRPPRLTEAPPKPAPEAKNALGGDHDGHTVLSDDIRRLRGEDRVRASRPPTPAVPSGPRYSLSLSTGGTQPLEGVALIGRAPSAAKITGGRIPTLVTIPGDQDISRNHVQLAVEGDTVVVTDLNSRNGTTVVLPGRAPQHLRANEPTAVLVGTVVDLGGGVTITVGQDQ